MTLDEFRQSLTATELPAGLTHALAGLWWDAKGDWKRAHESAQQDEGVEGSWVHAYLHRKEGDQSNAAYWYTKQLVVATTPSKLVGKLVGAQDFGRSHEPSLPRKIQCGAYHGRLRGNWLGSPKGLSRSSRKWMNPLMRTFRPF
jgi:hypothetical protein